MSLVAYDSSDESGSGQDSEDEDANNYNREQPTAKSGILDGLTKKEESSIKGKEVSGDVSTERSTGKGLFSLLPAPKKSSNSQIIEEDLITVTPTRNPPKKETIKISIPSMKEFQDVDEEENHKKKRQPSQVGSGLIGMLPAPQHLTMKETARQLVPLSVSRKATSGPPSLTPPTVSSKPPKSVENAANVLTKRQEDNDSDEEAMDTDFFSFTEPKEPNQLAPGVPAMDVKSSFTIPKPVSTKSNLLNSAAPVSIHSSGTSSDYSSAADGSYINDGAAAAPSYDSMYPQNQSYLYANSHFPVSEPLDPPQDSGASSLKNEAIVRLAGKKRRGEENIEFVDVNGDDLVAGRNEWLLKSLSETNSYQPAPKRSDQPSAMHRRKHQITYLAFQAKAREQELKNQWSMNRMTKKQTQSKYGF